MKKIIILPLLLVFTIVSFSQQIVQKQPLTQTDYFKKSKKQKKTGLILLAVGAGLVVTSVVIPNGELTYDGICIGAYCSDKYKNDGIRAAFGLTGLVSMLGSVPFFIASGKNKRSANAVSFSIKRERASLARAKSITNINYPALSLKLVIK